MSITLRERFYLYGKTPDLDWSPQLTSKVLGCSVQAARKLHREELDIHRENLNLFREKFENLTP